MDQHIVVLCLLNIGHCIWEQIRVADVVVVQMGVDDGVNILRLQAFLRQGGEQDLRAALWLHIADGHLCEVFYPHAGVHQDVFPPISQQEANIGISMFRSGSSVPLNEVRGRIICPK